MSLRAFLGIIGAAAAAFALFMLLQPVSLGTWHGAQTIEMTCGNALNQNAAGAQRIDEYYAQMNTPMAEETRVEQCDALTSGRRSLYIPVGIVGAVVVAGAVLVRTPQ